MLDDLEKQKLITEKERETINDVGQITIGSRTIQFKEKIKIGDYVNYKPKVKHTLYLRHIQVIQIIKNILQKI